MHSVKKFFEGTARFNVEQCDYSILNRLRQYEVRDVSVDVNRLRFTVPLRYVSHVKLVLSRQKYSMKMNKNLFGLLNVFYTRGFLTVATVLCIIAFFILNNFVFNVRVIGVEGQRAREISEFVNGLGARPLTQKSGGRAAEIAGEIVKGFDYVAHASGKIVGNTLIFNVYSVTVAGKNGTGDIIAAADAVVTNIVVASGRALIKPGDIVRKGQVLIKGERQVGGIDVGLDEFGKLIQEPVYAACRAVGTVYADVKYSEFGLNTTADELLAKIVARTGIQNFDKVESFSSAPGVLEVVATVNKSIV
jgi:hypothetical protein